MSQEEFQEFQNHEQQVNDEGMLDPMATLPQQEEVTQSPVQSIKDLEQSLDAHCYFLGEVPQNYLVDPQSFLPLNSDRLSGAANGLDRMQSEATSLIQDEVVKIQNLQKKLHIWEDRIEKNKAFIASNQTKIKQNLTEIAYDKRNRDYWWGRAEQVMLDYAHAETSNRQEDWNWLIKKYGLKNADRTVIYASGPSVSELAHKSASTLAGEYKCAGNRYELARNAKEAENTNLLRENSRLKTSNETLQGFIAATYTNEVEPLQDGILLLKEFNMKLKSFSQEEKCTFGDLRAWAEGFLNDFLIANHRVPQNMVTEFRKLSSIPLPPANC